MTGTSLSRQRVGVIAMVAILLAGAASFVIVQQRTTSSAAKLQALADEAALAGVNALAASEGQIEAKRIEAANAAVRKAIASRSEIVPIISPSIDEMKMSVALTTSNSGRGPALTATARYVTAGSSLSPDKTADVIAKKRPRG